MIETVDEHEKIQMEIRNLEERLQRLQQMHPLGSNGYTKAGIRKMIARFHEELAVFEGREESKNAESN